MRIFRPILYALGLLVAGDIAYVLYGYATTDSRVREVCSQIHPGMSLSELRAFAGKHGLGPRPTKESGINYLVETRTFGRYGCKVALEAGIVRNAEYNFAD